VWLRDLTSGKETAVTATPGNELHPRLTRDGSRLCYAAIEGGKMVIYVAATSSRAGVPQKICDDCGFPLDWSPDNTKIVYWRDNPLRWFTLDVKTRRTAELMPQAEDGIHNVQYSPDGEWLAFEQHNEQTLFITALKHGIAGARAEWIRVGDGTHPWWSADGRLLYFISSRDGFQCLWAQRIAPGSGRPSGESFAAHHFHAARRVAELAFLGYGLARNRFVLPIRETTGNVWMAKLE
jgi:Tol biopolymer transport system component